MITSTQAVIRIGHNRSADAAHLKRLALIFDRILFVLPEYWTVKDEVVEDPSRTERLSNGQVHFKGGLDPLKDTLPRVKIGIGQLGPELDHVLEFLVGHGIAEECDPTELAFRSDYAAYEKVRRDLGWSDATDEKFINLSKTSSISIPVRLDSLTVATEGGNKRVLHVTYPPLALLDSADLTATLFAAQQTGSSPIFTSATHRAELAYRFDQYKDGLAVLRDQLGEAVSPSRFDAEFGAVSFHIVNALVDSRQIELLSIEDVVEIRSSLDEARRRFISEHLVEATNLVEGNPWDDRLRDEVLRFVQGRLASELQRYDDESRVRVERLVSSAAAHILTDLPRNLIVGGGASIAGVTANLLPGASPWQVVLLACLGAAYKEFGDIKKDIAAKIVEDRSARRSSIAYVAELARATQPT